MNKRLLSKLVTPLFLLLFVYFYISNPGAIKEVLNLSWPVIIFAVIFQMVTLLISDLFTKSLVNKLGGSLNLREGYYSAFLSSFGNYFLPLTGGAALRAVYLKKQHNFSYKKFISISYGSYIVSFLVSSGIALLALIYIYFKYDQFIPSLFILMGCIFVMALSLSSSRIRLDDYFINFLGRFKRGAKLANLMQKIVIGWKEIAESKTLLAYLIFLAILNVVIKIAFFAIMFNVIGANVGLDSVILYNALISLSIYITITPGSLGIRESLLLFYSATLGISQQDALSVSLIDRASLFIALGVLFVIFQFVLKMKVGDMLKSNDTVKN